MNTKTESEKYGELLQEIARIIAIKDLENEELQKQIQQLKQTLNEAEKKGY